MKSAKEILEKIAGLDITGDPKTTLMQLIYIQKMARKFLGKSWEKK